MNYWLGLQYRWVDDEIVNCFRHPGDLIYFQQPAFIDQFRVWQENDRNGGIWAPITLENFIAYGGKLPAHTLIHSPTYLPIHTLGVILHTNTILSWTGGTISYNANSGNFEYVDREGRKWISLTDTSSFRLDALENGTRLPDLAQRNLQEGDTADARELRLAGYVETDYNDPVSHAASWIHRATSRVFIYDRRLRSYYFKQLSEEDWITPTGEYLTENQVHTCSFQHAVRCNGGCNRFFNNLPQRRKGCRSHHICSECMESGRHRHCPNCGGTMTDQVREGCPACNLCFNCRRECIYCPPNEAGATFCQNCCAGEHYNEEEVESEYIRPYGDRGYPPARPAFTNTLCKICRGFGVHRTNGIPQIICAACGGSGATKETNTPLWLGVELEVEIQKGLDTAAESIAVHYINDVILKHDSTIKHGFEVVTAPLSLEEHMKLWPKLSPDLIRNGCRSWKHTNTGLHIHTNRSFYSTMDICKLNVFINDLQIKPQIIRIAGRESVYAALKPKKITDGKQRQFQPHREALNISLDNTIELRVFKGTIALEHIKADIQFMHAAANWIKEASLDSLSRWDIFWAYVVKNRNLYQELINHFDRKVEIERQQEVIA